MWTKLDLLIRIVFLKSRHFGGSSHGRSVGHLWRWMWMDGLGLGLDGDGTENRIERIIRNVCQVQLSTYN